MKIVLNGEEKELDIIKQGDIYIYCLNGIKIGGYNPMATNDKIIFEKEMEKSLGDEAASQIKDQLNGLSDKEIETEALDNIKNEEILERDGYKRVTVFDLDEELDNEEEKEEKQRDDEKQEKIRGKEEKITTREVNIKDESELNEIVDGIKTLRNWIGGNIPPEYRKIGVIEADQADKFKDENGNKYAKHSSRYDLVLIDNKGNVKPLKDFVDVEQSSSHGTNPSSQEKGNVQVENDGTANNASKDYKNSGSTVLSLPNGKYLSIGMKEHGDIALYAGKEEYKSRNFASIQLQGKNDVFESNREERESVIRYYEGQHSSDEASKEAQTHKTIDEEECDEKEWKDVNGEPDSSHSHIDFKELAIKLGYHTDNGKPDEEKAKEKYEEEKEKNPEKNPEELIDSLEEEVEEQYRGTINRN